ncbi:hypothetical protein P154DRAFT_105036 [Amniculicola lignicola CBS 123094]|uniref:Uncharacterized protein n=1 Tax=Amniculicola lignicola CBS 123094 TaxID=1392246 RepID=A0A6A5WN49_9PLEO|nr:hypothetical protein P154DRAFT_105036 [Amniculicola lignicola CBS 123094]
MNLQASLATWKVRRAGGGGGLGGWAGRSQAAGSGQRTAGSVDSAERKGTREGNAGAFCFWVVSRFEVYGSVCRLVGRLRDSRPGSRSLWRKGRARKRLAAMGFATTAGCAVRTGRRGCRPSMRRIAAERRPSAAESHWPYHGALLPSTRWWRRWGTATRTSTRGVALRWCAASTNLRIWPEAVTGLRSGGQRRAVGETIGEVAS